MSPKSPIRFGREMRLGLAWLALLAPFPLPFNQVIVWPVYWLYAGLLAVLIHRADRGIVDVLPNWALNVLGLGYLPLLLVDVRSVSSGANLIRVLAHLLMFLVVVKLFSLQREREKWHVAVALFFLFIASMATSSHLTVALYLLVFLGAAFLLLSRFAHFYTVAASSPRDEAAKRAAPRSPLFAGLLGAVILAVPFFAFVPRFTDPFIFGRGAGTGSLIASTGFSDSVDLSLTTSIRGNRQVALRVQYSGDPGDRSEMRLKGATYDLYRDREWHSLRDRGGFRRLGRRVDEVEIVPGEPVATAEIFLEVIRSGSLPLPVEALGIEMPRSPLLVLDPGGAVFQGALPRKTVNYRVSVAAEPVTAAILADDPEDPMAALDTGGVSPEMAQLAAEVMVGATPEDKADRLEEHLLTSYDYTLNFVGRDGEDPLDDFLFVYKSGHCEYFASSMVLMLRSQGIPARLVTGFMGAEYSPLENYYIVRQQNAHAWVEAYTPERGWRIYDPTPPEGRPVVGERDWRQVLNQLYDYLLFRWDRYVLSFGAEDQAGFFQNVKSWFSELWKDLAFWEDEEEGEAEEGFPAEETASEPAAPALGSRFEVPEWIFWAIAVALLSGVFLVLYRARTRPPSAEAAYLALRRELERGGLEVPSSLPPLALRTLAEERFPRAKAAVRRLVGLYLRASFAGRELLSDERFALRAELRQISAAIDATRREERRHPLHNRPRIR